MFESYAQRYNRPSIDYLDVIPSYYTFPGIFSPGLLPPKSGMFLALDRVRIASQGRIDLVYKIEPDRIVVLSRNRDTQGDLVSVSETQGLIGTPKSVIIGLDTAGIELEMVVEPRIKIDSYISLQSRFAESGVYKVQDYTHIGSSIDGSFITRITGVLAE